MSIVEGTYSHGGVTVKYKYRKAIGDRRDLIVIFSGFRSRGTYDFDGGPAGGIRGNILWILDDFDESFAYYLCLNLDFSVERAVVALINESIEYLDISPEQCAVAGFSKGGSAALYYGIKYNYGAILATVPQFHVGSYVKNHWPSVYAAMTVTGSDSECDRLDSILPTLLHEDTKRARNIYLFSSESDPQHAAEIEPYLGALSKYDNFNYVLTASPLVDTHSAVTRYNVAGITSILSLLSEGGKPVLGQLRNGSHAPDKRASGPTLEQVRKRNEVIHAFTALTLRGSVLFPEGYAFVKGYPADDYGKVRTRIKFDSTEATHEVAVGGVKDPLLSTKFYEHQFCDYSVGKFASIAHKGIPLTHIPHGQYRLSLDVRQSEGYYVVPAHSERSISAWSAGEGSLYKIEANEDVAILTKRPALGPRAPGVYFRETGRSATGSRVHFEGHFAVQGIAAPDYRNARYYLVLCPLAGGEPVGVFDLASDHRSDAGKTFNDPWIDYSKAYYATPRYAGIEIVGIEPGQYCAYITARFGDSVFSELLAGNVNIYNIFATTATNVMPVVDIIGSCVSRDNFNSRLSPGWKSYFTLGNEHYQSAFLSLMSKAVEVPDERLDTGDLHSTDVTVRDFSKAYLSELIGGNAPDVMIIDLFADARFGCMHVDGSLVTDNEWKLHQTYYWKGTSTHRTFNLVDNEAEYLAEFRIAAESFNVLREKHFSETRIILNSARAVFSYLDNGAHVRFSEKFVHDLNARWAKLDAVFLQCVPADVISAANEKTSSDASHPWGPAPYHYESEYYRQFRAALFQLLGSKVTVSLP